MKIEVVGSDDGKMSLMMMVMVMITMLIILMV
jgi:hypothetical protein